MCSATKRFAHFFLSSEVAALLQLRATIDVHSAHCHVILIKYIKITSHRIIIPYFKIYSFLPKFIVEITGSCRNQLLRMHINSEFKL